MSAADIQLKINELEADIIDIECSNEFSFKEKVQYIDRKEEMIIILKKEIEKLSPAMNPTQRLTYPTLRANPYPEVTDLFCRLPLSTLFYGQEATHLGDLRR